MAGSITPGGSSGTNAIKQRWDAVFHNAATEEMQIGQDFNEPSGVTEVGSQLNIRVMPKRTANTYAGTGTGVSLTYDDTAIASVNGTPTFKMVAVRPTDVFYSRLGKEDSPKYEAAERKQCLLAIDEAVDQLCGAQGSGFSTLKGPGNLDKATLLDAQGTLATNAQSHVVLGQTPMHLKIHPTQIKYLHNIAEIMNAELRGDSENPNVKGVIVKAWGMTINETGNVQYTGGYYYNMLFAKTAQVLAWNMKPKVKPSQDFEATKLIIVEADACPVEVFDLDGLAIRSA